MSSIDEDFNNRNHPASCEASQACQHVGTCVDRHAGNGDSAEERQCAKLWKAAPMPPGFNRWAERRIAADREAMRRAPSLMDREWAVGEHHSKEVDTIRLD